MGNCSWGSFPEDFSGEFIENIDPISMNYYDGSNVDLTQNLYFGNGFADNAGLMEADSMLSFVTILHPNADLGSVAPQMKVFGVAEDGLTYPPNMKIRGCCQIISKGQVVDQVIPAGAAFLQIAPATDKLEYAELDPVFRVDYYNFPPNKRSIIRWFIIRDADAQGYFQVYGAQIKTELTDIR